MKVSGWRNPTPTIGYAPGAVYQAGPICSWTVEGLAAVNDTVMEWRGGHAVEPARKGDVARCLLGDRVVRNA